MLEGTAIIVWEGVDGAGKTTLMGRVSELLESKGYSVLSYKTPSNSPTGEFAKTYGNREEIDHLTRMLLFLANTSDDSAAMRRIIFSNHPDYYFIDRYYLCSIVYGLALSKVRGEEVGRREFEEMLNLVEKLGSGVFLKPDLYVVVDVSEEIRRRRLEQKRGQGGLEEEIERDAEMQENVREFYRIFAELRPREVIWVKNVEGRLKETASMVAEKLLKLRQE